MNIDELYAVYNTLKDEIKRETAKYNKQRDKALKPLIEQKDQLWARIREVSADLF